MAKIAFIIGVTGQDGSYLAELLLNKGYRVYGMQRRTSMPNTVRIDHLYAHQGFRTVYGDLSDGSSLFRIVSKIRPDEIYNLGAQSHVGVSFEVPEYTYDVNVVGALRVLEAVRNAHALARVYQASSSEMFGNVPPPQSERTPFRPCSPYGVSKVAAYETARVFRDAYGVFVANGILFNHESPRRGFNFVTRKITLGLSRAVKGLQKVLRLGNLDARRDWGYAPEYVEAMWRILQHGKPDDFVIATGKAHTVREFAEEAARCLGIQLEWTGKGVEERGINRKTGETVVIVDPLYFRPKEVPRLAGNTAKARTVLGWRPRVDFKKLVEIMVAHDLKYITDGGIVAQTDTSPHKIVAG